MSMTTELAQRMKAAAIRAKAATEDYVANRMSMSVCLSECEEFNNLSDGPDNIIALVEALEAAEKRNAEYRAALNNLAAVARRYLPDYDEHPEIQAADKLLESAAGVAVEDE